LHRGEAAGVFCGEGFGAGAEERDENELTSSTEAAQVFEKLCESFQVIRKAGEVPHQKGNPSNCR
jgi:hypothetical protein